MQTGDHAPAGSALFRAPRPGAPPLLEVAGAVRPALVRRRRLARAARFPRRRPPHGFYGDRLPRCPPPRALPARTPDAERATGGQPAGLYPPGEDAARPRAADL